ncbi:UDP-glucose 4-epimerase GalE [Exilibacterium tricleocarpae]|uniref:UDP-glucose 4-epimerase n=1 Tax=Exilibacterium tricleocarpae TaxID=2591008 RepID=A0A545T3K7_9GAMM|nr:UDP-glucose 4-epimerase GalE [Exilibacterium tricleocarpae]TQV71792.1 UDP-glucose 4-epimerase GalE [Exilibacterium tricleocarpae]
MAVLVTGGAGYIGSHTCIELAAAGFDPVVVDNFCNSKPVAVERVGEIIGAAVPVHTLDINDRKALRRVFDQHDIEAVLHFAGLKAVGESSEIPLSYYHNNVSGTLALCEVMGEVGVKQLIFSSSATVYGDPASVPIREDFPTSATNPYGRSKLMVEEVLRDFSAAPGNDWKITLLRYFNPIGAHESGRIGEDPQGIPNNLLPYVAQVAVGKLARLQVFGDDYPTSDGTGVRDYIHVVDLARGHVKALQRLRQVTPGCYTYNLGTGQGYSVLQVVKAFEAASGRAVPYDIAPRRPGDIAECFADPAFAAGDLDWRARFDLERMVTDAWRWQSGNPNGYG